MDSKYKTAQNWKLKAKKTEITPRPRFEMSEIRIISRSVMRLLFLSVSHLALDGFEWLLWQK